VAQRRPRLADGLEGPHNGWIVIIFALISLAGVRARARLVARVVTVLGGAAAMIFTRGRQRRRRQRRARRKLRLGRG
jgi:hypothetical protein